MKDVNGHNMMDLKKSVRLLRVGRRLTYQVKYSILKSDPINSAFLLQL